MNNLAAKNPTKTSTSKEEAIPDIKLNTQDSIHDDTIETDRNLRDDVEDEVAKQASGHHLLLPQQDKPNTPHLEDSLGHDKSLHKHSHI